MNLEQYENYKKQHFQPTPQDLTEQLLRLETEITAILGQLSLADPTTQRFKELDAKYAALLKKKREITENSFN